MKFMKLNWRRPKRSGSFRRHGVRCAEAVAACMEPLEPRLLLSFSDVSSTVFPGEPNIYAKFFDYDNDGWLDAARFTNYWSLWHNDAGVFSDQGPLSDGLQGGGMFAGDMDNDGWVDLFLQHQGSITVLRNAEGTGTFEKITHVPTLTGNIPGGGSVGDFNNDGYLDFYVGGYVSNYSHLIVSVPDATQPGGRGFDEAWRGDPRYVRSVTSADYDEDGDLDVYTSAYFSQTNVLYQNQRNGQPFPFTNIGVTGANGHSVGSQWGDLDSDGDLDLFLSQFAHPGNPESRTYRNEGPSGGFALTDIGQRGVFFRESYGTPNLGDFDNDGNLDLWLTAFGCPGYSCSDTNVLYQNSPDASGPNFTDVTSAQGLGGRYTGNDVWVDFDNDGDLDLITNGVVFRNNVGNSNSWLKVDLGGDGNSIGAIVKVTAGGTTRARQVESGYGEAHFQPLIIHFGLGSHTGPVDVEITWLDGTTKTLQTAVNQTIDPINGGVGTALPYVEDFNDGNANSFRPVSGTWTVNGAGRYNGAADSGQNAVSLVDLLNPLPGAVKLEATIQGKDVSGFGKNGLLIYDYQDENNFKFAGPFFGGNEWRIGQWISSTLQVKAQVAETIDLNTDYDVETLLQDKKVTLLVGGVEKLSYEFGGSVMDGDVGVGTRNAVSTFDDFAVQVPPVEGVLPYNENFDDGVADLFQPIDGAWLINASDRYTATPVVGGDAVSIVNLESPLPSRVQVSAVMNTDPLGGGYFSSGVFVFDYQGPNDFRFAGLFPSGNEWGIGRYLNGVWNFHATLAETLSANTDYPVEVLLSNNRVELSSGGVVKLSRTYGGSLVDGDVGLGTKNSIARFDDFVLEGSGSVATLPFSEDFDDGEANSMLAASGTWVVSGAKRYKGTPVNGQNAVSLIQLANPLPVSVELKATIKSKDVSGFSANGLLIFDYQNADNFKFAGFFVGTGKWQIGRWINGSLDIKAQAADTIAVETDYDMEVRLDDRQATLLEGGVEKLSYEFGGSVVDGDVGVGTRNAVAVFDDLVVQVPVVTFPYSEDFEDGTADFLSGRSGTWQISGGRYEGAGTASGDAISTLDGPVPLPADLKVAATINGDPSGGGLKSNALLIFDYVDSNDFKYAGGFFGSSQWRIGHVSGGAWLTNVAVSGSISPLTDYNVELYLEGTEAILVADGIVQVSYDFAEPLTDLPGGWGTHNAVARFDNLLVEQLVGGSPSPPSTALPYSEDFEDGQGDYLLPLAGTWQAQGGVFEVLPSSNTIVTLMTSGLPSDAKFAATINGDPSGGGFLSNAVLLFDYQSPQDYKFAGGFFGPDQWRIGHVNNGTWVTHSAVDESLAALTNYAVELYIEGSNVLLVADGVVKVSHDFGESLTDGQLGLGTKNAAARFDNVSAEALTVSPPSTTSTTLPYSENFNDAVADFQHVTSGYWWMVNNRYEAKPAVGIAALSVAQLSDPLPSNLSISAVINADPGKWGHNSNAMLIFDYVDSQNYKYAGGFFGNDTWQIGHVSGGTKAADVSISANLRTTTDYALEVTITETSATLAVDGVVQGLFDYGEAINDGQVGLGTRNAVSRFDNLSIQVTGAGTALPYSEDFEDGTADALAPATGTWVINGAKRYRGTADPRENAVSLVQFIDPLPDTVDLKATVKSKDVSGFSANGLLIFDYQNADNFKFAGFFVRAGKWRIGRWINGGLDIKAQAADTIAVETDYDMEVRLRDKKATLLVGGVEKVSYEFWASVVDGDVGVGTRNAVAVFDDLLVETPGALLPYFEDFDLPDAGDYLFPAAGTWLINAGGRYKGTSAVGGQAISLLQLADPLPSGFDLSALLSGNAASGGLTENALLIFDYRGPTNFKYAGGFFGGGQWRIGHYDGSWNMDASAADTISAGANYDVKVSVNGTAVELLVGGVSKVSHDFGVSLSVGQVGVGTKNAAAWFDILELAATA